MTQRERIRIALERAGARGITQVDFLRFPTFDGGPPITRLAARIEELRNRDGLNISSSGTRDSCAVYVLKLAPVVDAGDQARAPAAPAPAAPGPAAGALFDPVVLHRPAGAYDDIDEAA